MSIREGDIIHAEVIEVKDNGIYLRHDGLDGFINVTNMTWTQEPVDPNAYATRGDHLEVLVYAVVGDRFYASIKDLHPEDDLWKDPGIYAVGRSHSGTVRNVAPFGAFVRLDAGAVGCLIGTPDEHGLKAGERVVVEVVAVDPAMRKIELEKGAS